MKLLTKLYCLISSLGLMATALVAAEPEVQEVRFEGRPETIRLLLKEAASSLEVTALDLNIKSKDGSLLFEGEGQTTVRLTPGPKGIRVDGLEMPTGSLHLRGPAGYVWVDGVEEPGSLTVYQSGPKLMVVLTLPIDSYLPGLLLGEVPTSWPQTTLQAQVIAARSYAMSRKAETSEDRFDLHSTHMDQVYGGGENIPFNVYQAVSQTKGQILTYRGEVLRTFYHSSCGGHGEDAQNVWPNAAPSPKGKVCTHCQGAPSSTWTLKLTGNDLKKRLASQVDVGRVTQLRAHTKSASGRWVQVEVVGEKGSEVVFGNKFRELLGYGSLKSLAFDVEISGGSFAFSGTGYGHGVGMCQWGSKRLGEKGYSAKEILAFYYPGAKLSPSTFQSKSSTPRGPPNTPIGQGKDR